MRRRRNANQEIMDRARDARRHRIFEEKGHFGHSMDSEISQEAGGRKMIKVTRLNGETIYLNILQIESMETIPETKIKMMNGYYINVKDSVESVLQQIREFAHSCINLDVQQE